MAVRQRILERTADLGSHESSDAFFRRFDSNRDGFVDLVEFKNTLIEIGNRQTRGRLREDGSLDEGHGLSFFDMTDAEVEELFMFIDEDKRNKLNFAEFSPTFARLCFCVNQDQILEAALRAWELAAAQAALQIRQAFQIQMHRQMLAQPNPTPSLSGNRARAPSRQTSQAPGFQVVSFSRSGSSSALNRASSPHSHSRSPSPTQDSDPSLSPTSSAAALPGLPSNSSSSPANLHPSSRRIFTLDQFAEIIGAIIALSPGVSLVAGQGINQQTVLTMFRAALSIEERRPSNFADTNGDLSIQIDTYALILVLNEFLVNHFHVYASIFIFGFQNSSNLPHLRFGPLLLRCFPEP